MKMNIDCIAEPAGCDNNSCSLNETVMIQWNHGGVIALYFVEFITLVAVLSCLGYLTRNRSSPLVQSCFSYLDYIVLIVLGIFCILPMAHIGEVSVERCFILWPLLSIIYAFYTALLMTKTVFLQNILGCEAPTDYSGRRVLFSVFILVLHIIIFSTLSITGLPTVKRYVCPTHGTIKLCDVRTNLSIIFSAVFNWFVVLFLFILTLIEAVNNSDDHRRAKKQTGLCFILFLSFSCLVSSTHLKLQLQYYNLVTFFYYVIYLINPVVSLVTYYIPGTYVIYACLHRQERYQKALRKLSAKRLKVFSDNVLFNHSLPTTFDPGRPPSCSEASEASSLSYPSSLACLDHVRDDDFIRIVPQLHTNLNDAEDGNSDESYHDNVRSISSYGDNRFSLELSHMADEQCSENDEDTEFTPEELTEILKFVKNLESTDV